MGTMEIFLCMFLGHVIAAQPVIKKLDATFFQDDPGFFDNMMSFPFDRPDDFPPYDTIFSSSPDFYMRGALPNTIILPKVEVFCDESQLTLLVDKRTNGLVLSGDELRLGDDCYSNKELPSQYVFTYHFNECGTRHTRKHGLIKFTNSLHLNLHKSSPILWPIPSTVHISCTPKRTYPNFFGSTEFPENVKNFNIKVMNPSWTSTAKSNVYERGQVVNLQVSAKTTPGKQLFIQSCSVSASPEPETRHKHAVIMNKGCTASLGSPHAVVEFVASDRADVVNLILNTSYLVSKLYMHCSVLISEQGVSFGSKSCNYNWIQSRWEDLRGHVEVCECCSSKCKGLPIKHLPLDAKAMVSAGPLVIEDKPVDTSPEPLSKLEKTSSVPVTDFMQYDRAEAEGTIVSGASVSRPPQSVVLVSQHPVSRLTLWLPGQVRHADKSNNVDSVSEDGLTLKLQASEIVSNEIPELQLEAKDLENLLNTPTNKIAIPKANDGGRSGHLWDLNLLTLVNRMEFPLQLEEEAFAEESPRKGPFGRSEMFDTEVQQEVDSPLTDEYDINVQKDDFYDRGDELAEAPMLLREEANEAQPIIRSKLQFSKDLDGSQTLSYEEQVMGQKENGVIRRYGIKRKHEPRQKALRSTFLDLLRRMDKAE